MLIPEEAAIIWRELPLGAEGCWGGAGGAKGAEAERIVAFGEAEAVFVAHEGAVEKGGRGPAEREVEEKLAGGGDEEVLAADDLGDLHGVIVHGAGELITGEIVVTPDDEVAEIAGGRELLRTETEVIE